MSPLTLEDIRQSISQMSDDELLSRVKGIRQRRDADAPAKAASTSSTVPKKTGKKKEANAKDIFSSLSDEAKEQLLKSLLAGGN